MIRDNTLGANLFNRGQASSGYGNEEEICHEIHDTTFINIYRSMS